MFVVRRFRCAGNSSDQAGSSTHVVVGAVWSQCGAKQPTVLVPPQPNGLKLDFNYTTVGPDNVQSHYVENMILRQGTSMSWRRTTRPRPPAIFRLGPPREISRLHASTHRVRHRAFDFRRDEGGVLGHDAGTVARDWRRVDAAPARPPGHRSQCGYTVGAIVFGSS